MCQNDENRIFLMGYSHFSDKVLQYKYVFIKWMINSFLHQLTKNVWVFGSVFERCGGGLGGGGWWLHS